ncbi:MAG: hypothetical protein AB7O38_31740 [Pirellulaceae bacterium]
MATRELEIDQIVARIEQSGGAVVRGFRTLEELRMEFATALAAGQSAVFAPTQKSARHFYNTPGFISAMQGILATLDDVAVIIEPNLYGQRLVFAVAPTHAATS